MLEPTHLAVSGQRFTATYSVTADAADIDTVARWMSGEMTVEFPLELIPDDDISRHIVGRVETVEAAGSGTHRVVISVADEVVSGSLTQLLSVVWGNVSLAPGINLVDLSPPELTMGRARGTDRVPGLERFRALAGAPTRPLLMTALKPLGLPIGRLAALAGDLAAGGIDVVKDDQSLANQSFAAFADRIGPIAEAIAKANEREGTQAVYAPSLNGPVDGMSRRARLARRAGASAVMVQPGISGYPAIEAAAEAGLPVIAHPGGFGGLSERVAPALVLGTLPRLAGAGCSVFITPGGRFDVSATDAQAILRACLGPLGGLPPILPAAGGGVTVERVAELRGTYGDDLCLLIGGDLHRDGNPRSRARLLRDAVEQPR